MAQGAPNFPNMTTNVRSRLAIRRGIILAHEKLRVLG